MSMKKPNNQNKANQGIIVGLVIVLIVAAISTSYLFLSTRCTADGKTVCYDKDTEVFKLESNVELNVQVESDALGAYLVSTWDSLHPEEAGAITYSVEQPLSVERMAKGLPYDVNVTAQNDAAYFIGALQNLGDGMDAAVGSKIPVQLQDTINIKGHYFVQNSIEGGLFVYNKTLLEEMGFNLVDDDLSGLPDNFESWDQIFEASPKIFEKAEMVYPLSFTDQEMFYPMLTSGRWTLNFTKRGSNPGFSSHEFLDGLKFVEKLSKKPIYKEKTPETKAESYPWQYETAFFERRAPFSYINDFDLADQYMKQTNDQYVYSPFPMDDQHRLSPMGTVNGYVVKKDIPYPSAAAEVIRILRSPEGVSMYANSTGNTPVYHRVYLSELSLDDPKGIEKVRAYNFHDTPPVMALDKNPERLARSLYKEVDFMPILRDLYDGVITPQEAQKRIVELSDGWLLDNDVTKEEKEERELKKLKEEKEKKEKADKEKKEAEEKALKESESTNKKEN